MGQLTQATQTEITVPRDHDKTKPVTAAMSKFEDSLQLHGYLDCLPRNRHLRKSVSQSVSQSVSVGNPHSILDTLQPSRDSRYSSKAH